MTKDDRSTATPRLRFPEFRDAPEWEMTSLSKMSHLVSGLHLAPDQYAKEGEIPYFTGPSDFTNDFHTISKWTDGSTNVGIENDVLITVKGSGVGEIWYLKLASVAMGRQLMAVRATNASSRFIYQFLLTRRNRFEDLASGNLIPGLSRNDILDLDAPLPSLSEQQKIADCLSSLDEVITAQGRKVETLQAHKRGLMQRLFPRGGEAYPRLRFPEFRHGPEWKEMAIGELGEVITGNTPATSRKEYYGGEHLFVSPADISDLRFVERTKTTLSEAGFAQSRTIKARSVLFVCIGSTIGKVAQNARECATNQQINSVVANSDFSGDFIYYLLHIESDRIAALAGIQAVPIINKTLFSSVKVVVPKLDEQNRIAGCLSSLDAQIAAESEKLDALKTHKQSLMQRLFPSPEAGL